MGVVVINESTVVSEQLAWRYAWSLDYQSYYHFYPAWKIYQRVKWLEKGQPIPAGSNVLHLLDTADVAGALGYHDEEGNEVAYARIFCKTSQEYGIDPCEVASHEFVELAVDPHINLSALDPARNRLYALEVGDPCQSNGYQVGATGNSLTVADFALPSYFDPNTKSTTATSYRKSLHGPFTIASQGYMSYIDLTKYREGWKQEIGDKIVIPPVDLDDRVARRSEKQPSTA